MPDSPTNPPNQTDADRAESAYYKDFVASKKEGHGHGHH